jgi:hypothetical protein
MGAFDDLVPQTQAQASGAFSDLIPQSQPITTLAASLLPSLQGVQQTQRDIGFGALRGAGSIGATLLAPLDWAAQKLAGTPLEHLPLNVPDAISRLLGHGSMFGNTDRRQQMTEATQDLGANPESLAYKAGKLGAEVAGTMGVGGGLAQGARSIPMLADVAGPLIESVGSAGMNAGGLTGPAAAIVRAAGGGITGATSAGLIDPSQSGSGAVIGAVSPAAAQLAGNVGSAIGSVFSPKINNPELAAKAIDQYGIPLGLADISSNKGLKGLRSMLNDVPVLGGIGEAQGAAAQQGFNKAVGQTFGADASSLTPEVMDAAKRKLGETFDTIWGQNTLKYDPDLFAQLQGMRLEAAKLPQGDAGRLTSWLDDIEGKMVPDAEGNLSMAGDVANRLQSKLRQQAENASGFLKDDLATLRKNILAAFNRNVSPEDAATLASTMGQYKALKTVQPLMQSAEAGVAGRASGNVPAGLLPNRVRQQYGDYVSSSPFSDLSQIGSQYLANRTLQTGGSARGGIQNMAIGGAIYANPVFGLIAGPAAYGAQKAMGSPTLANAVVQRALRGGLLSSPDFEQAALRAAPAVGAGLLGSP